MGLIQMAHQIYESTLQAKRSNQIIGGQVVKLPIIDSAFKSLTSNIKM